MAKNKVIPARAIARGQEKIVRATPHPSSYGGKPSWRFSTVDKDGPFAWPMGKPEESHILEKLRAFDSMTWDEIKGKQHHFLSPASLSKEAIKRLEEIERDDEIDNLFSFHLQGKPRIVCIRHNDLALLLWYDPEHAVAPSHKKHT